VIAGAGPVDTPGATEGITPLHWFGFKLGQYIPWSVWRMIVGWIFREAAADPTKSVDRDRDTRPLVDNEIFDTPEIHNLCVQSDLEAYRHGLLAFAWDARLLTRPWGFKLEEIKVPVHLWHGTLDNSTTLVMARHVEEKIPNCKLTVCEDEAHMLLIPRWEEILATLKQMSKAA
jgi:pimeloyl-ACP methyl ester carboxylesterase